MSLELDARQRAMLLEMGVHVWSPLTTTSAPAWPDDGNTRQPEASGIPIAATAPVAPPAQASKPLPVHPEPTQRAPEPSPGPTRVTSLVDGITGMDWPALNEAVRSCQACAMCLGRRAPVLAAPRQSNNCDWLLVGDPPDEAQERAGQPFVEEAGQLLDNMLRAVGVQRWNQDASAGAGADPTPASRAYLTHVLKCRPALTRAPNPTELDTCAHFLRREIALTQPRVILAMGRFAMHLLLSETPSEQARLPLGKLRGQVWRFAGLPVVVTYPPGYLLRNGQDKARAWADLCLARAVARGTVATP